MFPARITGNRQRCVAALFPGPLFGPGWVILNLGTFMADFQTTAALRAVAERVNTGAADPETSRALVVFNRTDRPLAGTAVFRADMAWPRDTPLPPVVIRELGGEVVPSALTDRHEGPDRKGRADRRQVAFALRFAVQEVPPQGWRTYIAAYTDTPASDTAEVLADATPGLEVIETLRHGGDLPPVARAMPLTRS